LSIFINIMIKTKKCSNTMNNHSFIYEKRKLIQEEGIRRIFLHEFIAWNWCDVCSSSWINCWRSVSSCKSNVRSFGLLRNVVVINDSVSTPEKSLYGSVVLTLVVDVLVLLMGDSFSLFDDDDDETTIVVSVVTVLLLLLLFASSSPPDERRRSSLSPV
jgi:hypothetical protein